jgi:YVTN family beta-propeller protein
MRLVRFLPILLLASLAHSQPAAVLPNGREIHPIGNWIPLAPFPFAISIRPDGNQIAIPSIGFPFALNVVDAPAGPNPSVRRMPAGTQNDPAIEVHAGLAYSRDGQILYVATGDSGLIRAYSTASWKPTAQLSLDGPIGGRQFSASFAATLVLSPDGNALYVLDQGNWRVVVIDTRTFERIASIATGAYPFGLALSPDGSRLYVTNSGLFEYKTIPGADAKNPLNSGLHFPPFGYPSREAREGATLEGRLIPGLGDENSTLGSSLWTYSTADPAHPAITARLRLGGKISSTPGASIGSATPTGIAAGASAVYVTLAHEDAVVKVSPDGAQLLGHADLSPFAGPRFLDSAGRPLRGVMPSAIALRNGRLYVAESGINAVAVLDSATMAVLEHIPVGWNPSALDLSPDGTLLYVVNAKGRGAGPNAGKGHTAAQPTYIGSLELGSLSVIPLASLSHPASLTAAVVAANTAALADHPALPHLKHCFLVIRENRTYDEILGDIPGANGDPSLARYGIDGWAADSGLSGRSSTFASKSASHLKVTPNLHALAARFAISDNFYVDSDVSADGHRWVLGIQPTPFFNTAWTSGYGGRRTGDPSAPQPGRRALFGGADAPMPEDEPQFGALWEHVAYAPGSPGILNYGEGLEVEGSDEMDGAAPEGQRLFLNAPVPRPVFESSDRRYPTFNLGIPDQFRATEFERDFRLRLRLAAGKIPALIVIRLPNDHTADPRPADGYPYRASYVADNDLALGRIVAFLSRTSIWRDSALFVTEDDAQDGVDHVDAHRSILLVASPWVRPGSVSRRHTSMGSIARTIDELLGLGSENLEDALAADIGGIFDDHPHIDPFITQPSDSKVFSASRARFARPRSKEEAARLRDMDDPAEIRKEIEGSSPQLSRPRSSD